MKNTRLYLKKYFKSLIIAVLVISTVLINAACTVVRISDGKIISGGNEADSYLESDEFDAETYVEGLWDKEIIPYVQENAKDYAELDEAIKQDFKTAGEKYGQAVSANAKNFSFVTKTSGKVLEYNDKSRVGYLALDVEPFDNTEDLKIYVGPVFKGDALRNSLPFIKFTDFKSQNDWAKVSKSLHNKLDNTLISNLDLPSMTGKEIEVYGAFTATQDDEERFITPVLIQEG